MSRRKTVSEQQAKNQTGAASIRMERKHPLAIRWMHWANFPVLFTMIWSGLLIYWNDSDNAYLHAHRVYRVGLGRWTLFRFFPDWFYRMLHVPYHVTMGLSYHFFFMWIFALNGVAWVRPKVRLSGNAGRRLLRRIRPSCAAASTDHAGHRNGRHAADTVPRRTPAALHTNKVRVQAIKRIGLIAYTNSRPDDYWTRLGYDWYAGL